MKKLAILSMLLILLFACAPAEKPFEQIIKAEKPVEKQTAPVEKITLGAMFPLTGDGAAYGEPISRQMMITVDEINSNGGIDGKMLEIKLEDSKCTPEGGATAAKKLIEVDGMKVIFGGACSGETLGAAPIAEAAKVILISPSATSPKISDAGAYVFRTAPSDAYAGRIAAEKALSMGFKTAGIISENSDYAQGLKDTFAVAFTAGGGKIFAESYNPDETDFKTQILKISKEKPDVIYVVPQSPPKGVQIVKQLKELKVPSQLMTAEVLIGRDIVKENAAVLEGIIGIEQAVDESNPLTKQMLDAYRAKHGEPPFPYYQAAMRDALVLVANSIKENGLDADKIKDSLNNVKDWDGAVGKLTLDENGDALVSYSIKQVKNSQLETLQ